MLRRSTHRNRLAASAAVAFLFASVAHAQLSSINTKLLGRIDSRRIAEGAPFFVKTISDWKQGHCSIPMGATFEGRVVKVIKRGPGIKREELDLRFLQTPCATDDSQEILPILVAIQGPEKNSNDDRLARDQLMTEFASVPGGHPPMTAMGPPPAKIPGGVPGTIGVQQPGFGPWSPGAETIRTGEVRDYPGVKLSLPRLTADPTILTSSGELLFDPDARFVLVMRIVQSDTHQTPQTDLASSGASAAGSPSVNAKTTAELPHHVISTPVLVEDCVTGGCITAGDTASITAEKAQAVLPLRTLSYRPRTTRTVSGGLEDDAAISFLGDDQLFVTFNAHALVPRSNAEAVRSGTPRKIRGVLISASDGRRLRVVDWLVPDQGTYLWPLDRGRILVRAGNALIVYGRNLEEQARWELPGPLLFLSIAPSHNIIFAAVKHEKYDAATFRRLADFIGSAEQVQEDCDLITLNGQLSVTGSRRLTATPEHLSLLDTGLVSAIGEPASQWKIEETDWNAQTKRLAELSSGCTPVMQSLPPNLLFVSGCKADSSSRWYRVLRSNGKTLLRGETTNRAIPEYVAASPSGNLFAIGVEHAIREVDWQPGIRVLDLESMTVAVYRASDGKQIYATKVPSHAVDRRVFALSDSGRLAVLTNDSVRLYDTR